MCTYHSFWQICCYWLVRSTLHVLRLGSPHENQRPVILVVKSFTNLPSLMSTKVEIYTQSKYSLRVYFVSKQLFFHGVHQGCMRNLHHLCLRMFFLIFEFFKLASGYQEPGSGILSVRCSLTFVKSHRKNCLLYASIIDCFGLKCSSHLSTKFSYQIQWTPPSFTKYVSTRLASTVRKSR